MRTSADELAGSGALGDGASLMGAVEEASTFEDDAGAAECSSKLLLAAMTLDVTSGGELEHADQLRNTIESMTLTYVDIEEASETDEAGIGSTSLPFETGRVAGLAIAFAEVLAAILKPATALLDGGTKVDTMDSEGEE